MKFDGAKIIPFISVRVPSIDRHAFTEDGPSEYARAAAIAMRCEGGREAARILTLRLLLKPSQPMDGLSYVEMNEILDARIVALGLSKDLIEAWLREILTIPEEQAWYSLSFDEQMQRFRK